MKFLKSLYNRFKLIRYLISIAHFLISLLHSKTITKIRIISNSSRNKRFLEIGPGSFVLEGYETLNIRYSPNVTYVLNASGKLPFNDDCFDEIFASHVLEHIPWYEVDRILLEWVRIIKPGGKLTIWVPDGFKVAKSWVEYEEEQSSELGINKDGWYRLNDEKIFEKWVSGRIFSYGDGRGTLGHPNWHMSLYSESYLHKLFVKSGLTETKTLSDSDRLGNSHGWIEVGVMGIKK